MHGINSGFILLGSQHSLCVGENSLTSASRHCYMKCFASTYTCKLRKDFLHCTVLYIHMYVCMHMYIHTYKCMYRLIVCIYTCIHNMHICTYMCVCVYVWMNSVMVKDTENINVTRPAKVNNVVA